MNRLCLYSSIHKWLVLTVHSCIMNSPAWSILELNFTRPRYSHVFNLKVSLKTGKRERFRAWCTFNNSRLVFPVYLVKCFALFSFLPLVNFTTQKFSEETRAQAPRRFLSLTFPLFDADLGEENFFCCHGFSSLSDSDSLQLNVFLGIVCCFVSEVNSVSHSLTQLFSWGPMKD